MKMWALKQTGFTIVELLIVIVVIAILASIAIVAYNGITNQARASSASLAAEQAVKKVSLYAVKNGDTLPATLALADVEDIDSTYQYRVYNDGANYCVTATIDQTSFYIDNETHTSPTQGACLGHIEGGGQSLTNWAINPDAVGSTTHFGASGTGNASWSTDISSTRSHHGSTALRRVTTSTASGDKVGATVRTGPPYLVVKSGQQVFWSFWIYSTRAGTLVLWCDGNRVSDGVYAGVGGGSVSVPANTWQKVIAIGNPTVDLVVRQCGGYNLITQVGDQVWFDEFTISTKQPMDTYADGNSAGWVWNGTPHESTSIGPID